MMHMDEFIPPVRRCGIQLQDSARRSDAFDIIICTKVRVWRLAPSQCSGKPETQC